MAMRGQQGSAIHIGLNHVDESAYNGWNGQLTACVNDARAMEQITSSLGYSTKLLTDENATAQAVLDAIANAAEILESDGTLVLTYSGHGGQVDDANSDEPDAIDETWICYDRNLIDDELYKAWMAFASGARIFMLSDSCHSGTVAKAIYTDLPQFEPLARAYGLPPASMRGGMRSLPNKLRLIPSSVLTQHLEDRRELYREVKDAAGGAKDIDVQASLILISGCQDNQLSADGVQNGLFTEKLLKTWDNGNFDGTYRSFHTRIVQDMPPSQTPNYVTEGLPNPAFEAQKPFTLATPIISVGPPSVHGPESLSRDDYPPTFEVDTVGKPYYIFEITSDWSLFDTSADGRTANNFYATWDDANAPSRLTDSTYTLSQETWDLLNQADRLWYRIGTISSESSWDDYVVSTKDDEGDAAPSIEMLT